VSQVVFIWEKTSCAVLNQQAAKPLKRVTGGQWKYFAPNTPQIEDQDEYL
jgi:hypothetical protein